MAIIFVLCVSSVSTNSDLPKILASLGRIPATSDLAVEIFPPLVAEVLALALVGAITASLMYLLRSTLGSTDSWFPVVGALLVLSTSLDFPLRSFLTDVSGARAGSPLLLTDLDFLLALLFMITFLIVITGRANTLSPWRLLCAAFITFASIPLSPRISLFAAAVMGFTSVFELLRFKKVRWTIIGGLVTALAIFPAQSLFFRLDQWVVPQTLFQVNSYHLLVNLCAPLLAVIAVTILGSVDPYEVFWRFRNVWILYFAELLVIIGDRVVGVGGFSLGPEFIFIHVLYWMPFLALMGRFQSSPSGEAPSSSSFFRAARGLLPLLSDCLERIFAPLVVAILVVYMSAGVFN